jgi:hypothetical protein
MGAIFYAALRAVGPTVLAVVALLAFYEGIPGAHRVPFLSSVPVIGDLATGRVHSYAADQVAIEKAKCNERVRAMVSTAEYEALKAQIERERQMRELAQRLTREAAARATEAIKERERAMDDLESRIAADTADGCRWTEEDAKWRER